MAGRATNEGFYGGETFVCTAIPAPDMDISRFRGRAVNAGFQCGEENSSTDLSTLPSDLRHCDTERLIAFVQLRAASLTPAELRLIHSIALERLIQSKEPTPQRARFLSELVMEVAANQIRGRNDS